MDCEPFWPPCRCDPVKAWLPRAAPQDPALRKRSVSKTFHGNRNSPKPLTSRFGHHAGVIQGKCNTPGTFRRAKRWPKALTWVDCGPFWPPCRGDPVKTWPPRAAPQKPTLRKRNTSGTFRRKKTRRNLSRLIPVDCEPLWPSRRGDPGKTQQAKNVSRGRAMANVLAVALFGA